MKYKQLGDTQLQLSAICLGSMTWGTQNTEVEGHQQMDYALDHGVNIVDTAEMYPTTPMAAATQGRTEEIIGSWLKKGGNRREVVIATKVTGVDNQKYIHDGMPINPKKIQLSLESSLKRLQTDCIDLYQLHWPNRGSYHFRQYFTYNPTKQNTAEVNDNIREVLFALQRHIDEGKIKYIGLSNESCWGTGRFLQIAMENNLPRVVSVQNEYSLLNRIYDLDLAELSHHENIGLLGYSPLAAGLLSGKYADGKIPEGSRGSLNNNLFGRMSEFTAQPLEQYLAIAKKYQIPAAQLALAFCLTRPFMISAIIGATTMAQLKENIAASEVELSDDILAEIQMVFRQFPVPM